jgi:uncharacterized protein (DUF2141 family)
MTERHLAVRRCAAFGALVIAVVLAGCNKSSAPAPPAATSAATPSPSTPTASTPSTTTGPAAARAATLTVTVTDLRNRNGQLVFGVFTAADGFPTDRTKSVNWQAKDPIPADGPVTFTCTLPPGKYAASVLHDENRNGDMDRGAFGIPKEGYGVTNNPKPKLRQATFDEATFDLPPEGKAVTISVQYFP